MGTYLNPSGRSFEMALNSEIFIDKSGLIKETNKYINTLQRYMFISKYDKEIENTTIDMLAAYYERNTRAETLFENLEISRDKSYRKHLNQYDVLKINMQEFFSSTNNIEDMINKINHDISEDFLLEYNKFYYRNKTCLLNVMQDVYKNTRLPYVVIIDEWDCVFKEETYIGENQRRYRSFIRGWLKDKGYIALAYMVGKSESDRGF